MRFKPFPMRRTLSKCLMTLTLLAAFSPSVLPAAAQDTVAPSEAPRPIIRPVPDDALTPRPRPRPASLAERAQAILEAGRRAELRAQNAASTRNPRINAAATIDDGIVLDSIALIGVFGTEESRRALLRMETGEFVRVSLGATVDGWRIIAIGPEEVRLLRARETRLVRLPE